MYRPTGAGGNFFVAIGRLFIEPFFLNFLSFIFMWTALFAHLVWFAERKGNSEEFPPRYLDGIDDAVWWAAVTVTTVGYGDKAPKSPAGRIIGLVWMLFGLGMFSVLSGHMSQRFVQLGAEDDIETPPDLQDWRVCSYATTFSQPWLRGVRFQPIAGASIEECGELLRTFQVDAILMDTPIMQYYRANTPWCSSTLLTISPALARPLTGLIFREGSPIRSQVNAALLDFIGTADYAALVSMWFPRVYGAALGTVQLTIVLPAAGLLLMYLILQSTSMIYTKAKKTDLSELSVATVAGSVRRLSTSPISTKWRNVLSGVLDQRSKGGASAPDSPTSSPGKGPRAETSLTDLVSIMPAVVTSAVAPAPSEA